MVDDCAPDDRGGFQGVYIIAPDKDGPAKVGISYDPSYRLRTVQGGSWRRLYLYELNYFYPPGAGLAGRARAFDRLSSSARAIEKLVHGTAKQCEVDLIGEWLAVSTDDASAIIEKCCDQCGLLRCRRAPDAPLAAPDKESLEELRAFCDDALKAAEQAIEMTSKMLRHRRTSGNV